MAVVASLFFVSVLIGTLWLIGSMLTADGAAIVRALRMETALEFQPLPPAAASRRAFRTRSATAPAQWRAAA